MPATIKARFPSRREVELAVEHLVQEHGIARTDVFIEPEGRENSAGEEPAGADVESGHPGETADAAGAAYEGSLIVSIDINDRDEGAIVQSLRDAGGVNIDLS